ncbi:MAG TPA: hypothetical protein VGH89_31680 [Pseudonocardia sp.]|jgi:hypothetical protein
MNSQGYRGDRPASDYVSALRDPIVPLGYGNWFRRVFEVFRNNFTRLAPLALAPTALGGLYLIVLNMVRLTPAEVHQRLVSAAAASPTGQLSQGATLWIVLKPVLPISVIFLVLLVGAAASYQACAYYLILRIANGQPAGLSDALRVALPRVPRLVGWGLLAWLLISCCIAFPLMPGVLTNNNLLIFSGVAIAVILAAYLSVSIAPSLVGVVVIERAGLGRCLRLVRRRFWATFGRLVPAMLIYAAYNLVLNLILNLVAQPFGGMAELTMGGTVLVATVRTVLTIPPMVYFPAVTLVSYAELRFQENSTASTRTLAAEMTRRPGSVLAERGQRQGEPDGDHMGTSDG